MGFRRSEVRILSPRLRKASRDNNFRLAFFHLETRSDRQGRVAGRDSIVPLCPITFLGNLIRGCCHPPAVSPSEVHPRLVRALSTHFGP